MYTNGDNTIRHTFFCVNMQIGKVVLVNIPTHPSPLRISTLFIIGKNNFIEMRLHGKSHEVASRITNGKNISI